MIPLDLLQSKMISEIKSMKTDKDKEESTNFKKKNEE